MNTWSSIVTKSRFHSLAEKYVQKYGLEIMLFAQGKIRLGAHRFFSDRLTNKQAHLYDRMISESVRWGEPNIDMDDSGVFVWCVPVFINNAVVCGIFSADGRSSEAVREAAWGLLDLSTQLNLVNAGLMQLNRMVAQTAARRAEAIHQSKRIFFQNPHDLLLIEERELLNAVKNKNIEQAREIINRILVGVYHIGGADFEVLKLLILEMVVQMYRAAVSEGAVASALLGVNSAYLVEFLQVTDEYRLNRWLLRWLDLFVNTSFNADNAMRAQSLTPALLFIKRNLDKPITRDRVANVCHISPSYFSRLVKQRTGYTFSELVNKFRVEHACALLERTALSASEIAFTSGFNDQSYFTKVFKKRTGKTPGEYRAMSTTGSG